MPNRIIKESICTSDTIAQLSPEEERLFYRLIVNCEDYGRMEARPEIIRAKCFPLLVDKITVKDIENWLSKLVEVGLIEIYENHNKRYLQYLTWGDHQQIRASKPKYPGPDEDDSIQISFDINCNQENKKTNLPGDIICNQVKTDVPEAPYIRKDRISKKRITSTEESEIKNKYLSFVYLTNDEYQRLITDYGETDTRKYIESLDDYIGQIGEKKARVKYSSHYHTIKNWMRRDDKKPRDGLKEKVVSISRLTPEQQRENEELTRELLNLIPKEVMHGG